MLFPEFSISPSGSYHTVCVRWLLDPYEMPKLGSRRWNWKFREKHFWIPNPEFLLHSSYSFWLWLSTSDSGWDLASTLPWKNVKNSVTEVLDSDFKNAFLGIFNFTVGILTFPLRKFKKPSWIIRMDRIYCKKDCRNKYDKIPFGRAFCLAWIESFVCKSSSLSLTRPKFEFKRFDIADWDIFHLNSIYFYGFHLYWYLFLTQDNRTEVNSTDKYRK